jgi:cytochrome c peroxidase
VSCATCHAENRAFTDSPLATSRGIHGLTGTRNAPTVANSVYSPLLFWDGRSPSLEDQSLHPFLNPVEMGLPSHDPILAIVRTDPDYQKAFREVFGKSAAAIGMTEVTQAIASFERTVR